MATPKLNDQELADGLSRAALQILSKKSAAARFKSVSETNAKIVELESRLGIPHRPPIFSVLRANAYILELEARLGQPWTGATTTTTRPATTPLPKPEPEPESLTARLEKIHEPLERAKFVSSHYEALLADQQLAIREKRAVYPEIDRTKPRT